MLGWILWANGLNAGTALGVIAEVAYKGASTGMSSGCYIEGVQVVISAARNSDDEIL